MGGGADLSLLGLCGPDQGAEQTKSKAEKIKVKDVQFTDSTVATIWQSGGGRAEHMKAD